MDEKNEGSSTKQLQQSLPFLEVLCKNSGKISRFSVGTEAGFAVNLINKKLMNDRDGVENVLIASHIEAVKEGELGEEPVSFGYSSLLVIMDPVGSCKQPLNRTVMEEQSTRAQEECGKLLLGPLMIIIRRREKNRRLAFSTLRKYCLPFF